MMLFKVCPDCGVERPVSDFGKNAKRPDGLQFYCRSCCSRRSAQVYRRKRARLGKTVRERIEVPPGHKRCPACQLIKPHSEWHRATRSRDGLMSNCKACSAKRSRRDYLRRTFGIDEEQLAAMIEAQGGVCAICRTARPEHVDHDHATGVVRGVLCGKCNMGLGLFDDESTRLADAISYLERHRRDGGRVVVHVYEPPQRPVIEITYSHHAA